MHRGNQVANALFSRARMVPQTRAFAENLFTKRVATTPLSQHSFARQQQVKRQHQFRCYVQKMVQVPSMGDSITEGEIQSFLKNENDFVKEDDVICQIETDKITADVRAPAAGKIVKILAKKKDKVAVGQDLFVIDTDAQGGAPVESAKSTPAQEKKAEAPKPAAAPQQAPAAPKPTPAAAPAAAPAAPSVSAPQVSGGARTERKVPMTRMRAKIAERLKASQNTYAMLTTFNQVDMTKLTELRNRNKDAFQEKHNAKLGFMSAFVKASACALIDSPNVNAVIDGQDILYRDYVDISVAVATPTGLVVPVLRNCEEKTFADIEKEIASLGERARKGGLTLGDMQGGTFTISNGGVFGSLFGTPIINPPQSAILGMHAVEKRPVVVNDQIVIRPMMYLALTYDHRIIDGREAVTFLRRIKELIEDPEKMLLV